MKVTTKSEVCDFMLFQAQPLNVDIVQHGPFVMGSSAEIQQAMIDFQLGTNGFEFIHEH